MCGLFGIAAPKGQPVPGLVLPHLLGSLALLNQRRGNQSTGLALISKGGSRLFKRAVKAEEAIEQRGWQGMMKAIRNRAVAQDGFIVLGHTRLATCGDTTDRNAHPFHVKRQDNKPFVIGAHNGSITAWKYLANKYKLGDDIEVDSEVIFRGLQENDDGEWLGGLTQRSGIATTYVKEQRNILSVFRGMGAQISMASIPELNLLMWSSNEDHLNFAAHGFEHFCFDIDEDTLIQFDMANCPIKMTLKDMVYDGVKCESKTDEFIPVLEFELARKRKSFLKGQKPKNPSEKEDAQIEKEEIKNIDKCITLLGATSLAWRVYYSEFTKEFYWATTVREKEGVFISAYKKYPYGKCCTSVEALEKCYNYNTRSGATYLSDDYDDMYGGCYSGNYGRRIDTGRSLNIVTQVKQSRHFEFDPHRKAACFACKQEDNLWMRIWFDTHPYCLDCYNHALLQETKDESTALIQ